MAVIVWKDSYKIGVASIDERNRNLLKMINALHDALQEGNSSAIVQEVFDGLTAYTMVHFAYEEKLFEQYDYNDSSNHIAEHKDLNNQLMELQEKMEHGDFMVSVELLSFLRHLFNDHILKTDMACADFYMSNNIE